MFLLKQSLRYCLATISLNLLLLEPALSSEQIVPDRALGTTVTVEGNSQEIGGGTQRGGNLFHGFERFSVPARATATFNLDEGVERAFIRIGGGEVSQIFGTITANHSADFYFLNPQGFLLGPEAQIDISGSFAFLGGDRLSFADGGDFSLASTGDSVLSISEPVGFHATQGSRVEVRGFGHNLLLGYTETNSLIPSITNAGLSESGLRAKPEQQVFLAAEEIVFDSGVLAVPAGSVSVTAAMGELQFRNKSIEPTSSAIPGSLILTDRALVDVSGDTNGSVFIAAGTIDVLNGSHILGQSELGGPGVFQIEATERLNVSGQSEATGVTFLEAFSGISTISVVAHDGRTSTLKLTAPLIEVSAGGAIANYHLFNGNGGRTDIQATDLLLSGASVDLPDVFLSQIGSVTESTDPNAVGSSINISAESVQILDGSGIISLASGLSKGGNISVSTDTVELQGALSSPFNSANPPVRFLSQVAAHPSQISSLTLGMGPSAAGGSVDISAGAVRVLDGAAIISTTQGLSTGGQISISADEIELRGARSFLADDIFGSTILSGTLGSERGGDVAVSTGRLSVVGGGNINAFTASTGTAGNISVEGNLVEVIGSFGDSAGNIFPGFIGARAPQELSRLLDNGPLTGNSGDITITADEVRVEDFASIRVSNDGLGDSGRLKINAGRVSLRSRGQLEGMTFVGLGGEIEVTSDILELDSGRITTNSRSNANGGNISLQSAIITARNNSELSATAENGDGGTITFDVDGLFIASDTIVTAESESGRDGTVFFGEFTNLSTEVDLPVEPLFFDPEVLISAKCSPASSGRFTTVGDRQELFRRHGLIASVEEATGIATSEDGEVVLISQCSLKSEHPS